MALKNRASIRERLLDAATDLFYREGVTVGVREICRHAGISKRTLYQKFPSKDELLAASIAEQTRSWHERFTTGSQDESTPRERILDIFAQLDEVAHSHLWIGFSTAFAVINGVGADHPARASACQAIEQLRDFFLLRAEEAGASDADLLSRQLMLIFSGASAHARVREVRSQDSPAKEIAGMLLDSAGLLSTARR
ncbi:TetR/AcrR family transcriptional regulator [Streptomyces sp. NPDC056704]|uniref:TetR/AcrR family transcriptional regulator n=1 Tax=Streptomyces TaxID=1883 RepID=UPI0036C9B3D9